MNDTDKFIVSKDNFEEYITPFAWGLDMLRAINELGRVRKWFIRLALGRYAYRELVGMRDSIEEIGFDTTLDYGLENMKYHNDKVSL